MKIQSKLCAALAAVSLLALPALASATPPSHAKAWGWRCKGLSKAKDPLTKSSSFKDCVRNKGAGFVLGADGHYTVPVVVAPTDPSSTGA